MCIGVGLLLLSLATQAAAQNRLSNLRSWDGKYPTQRTGKIRKSFFRLPAVRQPLLKLLKREDFNLLTKEYTVETPVKRIGDYLAVKVCRPHECDSDQAGFAINLRDGSVYVRMYDAEEARWFSSTGKTTGLPQAVLDYLNDFSAI